MEEKLTDTSRGSPSADPKSYPDYLFAPGPSEAKKHAQPTPPPTVETAHTRPIQNSAQCHTVILFGAPIAALIMDGIERLCLAQISNILLKEYSYNEIHNRRVALGVTCVQCTPVQLEMLRRVGAMPASSRRCGMITMREAERLCKSFLVENTPPKLPENFAFDVYHKCAWGCRGSFIPSRYNSSRAKCVKCRYCSLFFSPNKFIFHTHRLPESKYRHPDAANFNSWRRHIFLCDESPSDALQQAWEDVKAMFNGGNRRRVTHSSDKPPHVSGIPPLPGYLEPYGCHSSLFQLEKLRMFPPLPSYGLLCEANKTFPPLRGMRREEPPVEPSYSPVSSISSVHPNLPLQRNVSPYIPDPTRHFMRTAGIPEPPAGINFSSADALRGFLPHQLALDPFWKGALHPGSLPPTFLNPWHTFMLARGQSPCLSRPDNPPIIIDEKSDCPQKRTSDPEITSSGMRKVTSHGIWKPLSPLRVEERQVPASPPDTSSAFRPLVPKPSSPDAQRASPLVDIESTPSNPILKTPANAEGFASEIKGDSKRSDGGLLDHHPIKDIGIIDSC